MGASIKIPDRSSTEIRAFPAVATAAADDLANAIIRLRKHGVIAPPDGRLTTAVSELRQLGDLGVLPTEARDRQRALNALFVALDFSDIARFLPPQRVAEVRRELSTSMGGSLQQEEIDRQYLQLQSQHWVGAVLAEGGLDARPLAVSAIKG